MREEPRAPNGKTARILIRCTNLNRRFVCRSYDRLSYPSSEVHPASEMSCFAYCTNTVLGGHAVGASLPSPYLFFKATIAMACETE